MTRPTSANARGPIVHIVGARPNFMKLAPVHAALAGRCRQQVVHTGQHYDRRMSDGFFETLGIPDPDHNLRIGSGSHAQQTAAAMLGIEQVCNDVAPACLVVYGDVNSTVAAAMVAAKLGIPCHHVEAGLRSRDRGMPEEINRLVTDQLSDLLFIHSREAAGNLAAEGIGGERVHFVGNVMIDTLVRMLPVARAATIDAPADGFALVTLHRPSNVDDGDRLRMLYGYLERLSERIPVVFPVHPRTRAKLEQLGLGAPRATLHLLEPQDYAPFLALQARARFVVTDSGGIQEETTYLGTPCLTLRASTERPVTVEVGSNTLVGEDPAAMDRHIDDILAGRYKTGAVPELWDGQAGARIAAVLESWLG
jgi:UDP-N-acetylglucosamine 2-epimerase (non-hydrolysing)